MKRLFVGICVSSLLWLPTIGMAQDASDDAGATQETAAQSTADKLKQNPDDVQSFNSYMSQTLVQIQQLSSTDPDQAEVKLKEMKALLESLEPTTDTGKQLTQRGLQIAGLFERRIALASVTLDELMERLQTEDVDANTVAMFAEKLGMEVSPIARDNPEKADAILKKAQDQLAALKEKSEGADIKQALSQIDRMVQRLQDAVETGKRLLALVGSDAAPLEVEAWVNGEPLSHEDLKGKVVLLDFWAVWCGPCIATFPHLREWQEEYAEKGLVIVGLTRYYNYVWNEEKEKAERAAAGTEVKPEDEQAMLEKFAAHHDLHHRLAIQQGTELSKFYAVTGIPHVVVIDRQGKVRMIRVGSGEKNANDIGELLEQLIAES